MKILIAVAFTAAGCTAVLGHVGVFSITSMIPLTIFAGALILTLLHLINTSDRRN